MHNNNLRKFFIYFRAAFAECPQIDDTTAQVLLLKGLEPNPYLLYSVLNEWQGGNLEDVYRKVWRVYTGVVHHYMMQQVVRTQFGSFPMDLDAFRQLPRSPHLEPFPGQNEHPLLTGRDVGVLERM